MGMKRETKLGVIWGLVVCGGVAVAFWGMRDPKARPPANTLSGPNLKTVAVPDPIDIERAKPGVSKSVPAPTVVEIRSGGDVGPDGMPYPVNAATAGGQGGLVPQTRPAAPVQVPEREPTRLEKRRR